MFNFIKKMDIVHQSARDEDESVVVELANESEEPKSATVQKPHQATQSANDEGHQDHHHQHQPDCHHLNSGSGGAGGGNDADDCTLNSASASGDHAYTAHSQTELKKELKDDVKAISREQTDTKTVESQVQDDVVDHKQTKTDANQKDESANKHEEVVATVEQSQREQEPLVVCKRDNSGEPQNVHEVQEVTSSTKIDHHHSSAKSMRGAARRTSYQSSRSYSGSFQNYGLTYLPYKSNFEPSEDARRRADEFFKTLKL